MPENLPVPNALIPNLLIPALLLLGVLIGAGFALRADSRNKRLLRRVDELVPARDALYPRSGRGADIRARRAPERRLGTLLLRILLVPVDLPAAHVISPRVVWSTGLVAAVLTALFAAPHMASPLAISAGLLIGALLLRAVFGWERSRYRRILLRQLPDAVQLVVSATRAGLPIREAFRNIAQEMPAPTNLEFGRIVNEMTLGVRPEDALFALHRRTGVGEYAIFAVTIGVQMKSGGRLAETIQTLAETVRQRQTMAARAHALASEARTSALILTSLPFVAGVLLSAIHPGYLDPLFQDPRGTRLLVIGAGGIVLGIWSMRQLIIQAARD
jgi:tight adherence protein B